MDISVRVKEIKGTCAVYKAGDTFRLVDGFKLVSDIPLCMHSLAALLPYYNALRISKPDKWGLAGEDDKTKAYVQCPDPYPYTGGGTAVFEMQLEQ